MGRNVSAVGSPLAPRLLSADAMKRTFLSSAIALMAITAGAAPARAQSVEASSNQALYEQGHRLLVGFGVGSGGGYVVEPDGFGSSAGLHVMPELGYFVLPHLSVSVQLREDIAFQDHWSWRDELTNGLALLARATWWFGDGPLSTKLSVFGGNGNYFHRVSGRCAPSGDVCTGVKTSGDKIAGVGIGLSYLLRPRLALTAGLDVAGGAPNRMVHADLNVGVTTRF